EKFIKNMLAGAGGISVCLFVVAANEGWMPQSTEHLAILDILGVRHGVVALTKADTVDEDMLELARAETEERLADSSLARAIVVAVSAVKGTGLDELVSALDAAVRAAGPAPDIGRPRLWIDRVFTIAGAGTVVTGTLAGGALHSDAEVEISPEGRRARIRAIQSHKKEVTDVAPGNRVALNLVGLDRQGAERGDAVVRAGEWRPTTRVDATVRVLPPWATGRAHELTERGAHLLYAGSAETPVRVKLLGSDRIKAGEEGPAQLYLREPLPLARGDRVVLRDAGRVLTFGGGVVLDPLPPVVRRSDSEHRDLLARLDTASPEEAFLALVESEGQLAAADALLRSGARDPASGVTRLGDLFVSSQRIDRLSESVRGALNDFHAEHPLERGMPRELLRAAVSLDPAPFDSLMGLLQDAVEEGASVRLASHSSDLTEEQRRARDDLIARIEGAGLTPPSSRDLGADPALLRALERRGELVRIGDFHLTAEQARAARTRVRAFIEEQGPATVAQIRALLGTSRKYAVPLCEWLDGTGATLRRGDARVLGPRAEL
ncbi:MAG: selenocysteine-specific translation elongation factor, partial [Actinomycetota bacterium]